MARTNKKQSGNEDSKVAREPKKRISKFYGLLKILKKLKPLCRQEVISHLGDDALLFISECISQAIDKNSFVSKNKQTRIKNLFKNSSKEIRSIANPKLSTGKRRSFLTKHGAGIGTILAAVIPFVASLFAKK